MLSLKRISRIYVCGDVLGRINYTAAHRAWYACVNALCPFGRFKVDYRVIPWTTFTDPEVARVGLGEKDAKEKNIPYEVRHTVLMIGSRHRRLEAHGFVKVLTGQEKTNSWRDNRRHACGRY